MNESDLDAFLDIPTLAGLNQSDRTGIAGLLQTPAKGEFFFLLQLIGKSPDEVSAKLAEECDRRGGTGSGENLQALLPPSRFSWEQLTDAVNRLVASPNRHVNRAFWEKIRFVLVALPKQETQTFGSMPANSTEQSKRLWSYSTCKHCWRRVAHNSGLYRKTASHCFVHNVPSSHPLYRKHSRLARTLMGEQQAALDRIMTLVRESSSEAEAHTLILDILTSPNECLPHVAAYLDETGHDGTPEGLLWAFHGPLHRIADAKYVAELNRYIQYVLEANTGTDPSQSSCIFSYEELSRAEAWLTLLGGRG